MVGANPKLAGQVDTIQEIIKRTADPKTLVKIVVAYPDWMSPTRYTAMGVSTLCAVQEALKYQTSRTDKVSASNFQLFPNLQLQALC
jgi:hypothetical protein